MPTIHTTADDSRAELDSFVYAVSHDLRAPIRSIRGFAQILSEDYADKLDDDGRDAVQRIVRAGNKLSDMLDGLLVYSRLARRQVRLAETDVSALAGEVAGDMGLTITTAQGIRRTADRELLRTVLAELFRNARNLVADDPELELLEEDGDVLVCDRGPGLKAEDCERIFKPFEQIQERTGVGMGLATVKRAMAMMDGEIAAEPREGGGACFRLTFG